MPYIVLRPDSVYVPGPGDLGFSHCVVRVSSSTTVLFAYKWVRERARLFCKQTAVALTLGEGGATPCLYFPNSVFIQKPRRCPFREDFATAASLRSFIIYFFSGLRFQNLYLSFRFAEAGISQFLSYRSALRGPAGTFVTLRVRRLPGPKCNPGHCLMRARCGGRFSAFGHIYSSFVSRRFTVLSYFVVRCAGARVSGPSAVTQFLTARCHVAVAVI